MCNVDCGYATYDEIDPSDSASTTPPPEEQSNAGAVVTGVVVGVIVLFAAIGVVLYRRRAKDRAEVARRAARAGSPRGAVASGDDPRQSLQTYGQIKTDATDYASNPTFVHPNAGHSSISQPYGVSAGPTAYANPAFADNSQKNTTQNVDGALDYEEIDDGDGANNAGTLDYDEIDDGDGTNNADADGQYDMPDGFDNRGQPAFARKNSFC